MSILANYFIAECLSTIMVGVGYILGLLSCEVHMTPACSLSALTQTDRGGSNYGWPTFWAALLGSPSRAFPRYTGSEAYVAC